MAQPKIPMLSCVWAAATSSQRESMCMDIGLLLPVRRENVCKIIVDIPISWSIELSSAYSNRLNFVERGACFLVLASSRRRRVLLLPHARQRRLLPPISRGS